MQTSRQIQHAQIQLKLQGQQIRRQLHHLEESAKRHDEDWNKTLLQHQLGERLQRINQAEQRLDDGSYGICHVCMGEIEAERLEALPEATTCITCMHQSVRRHLRSTQLTSTARV